MTTFGTVALVNGRWIIACEPHIRSRLKRVFPRVPQHAAEQIAISDTPENSRELLWFLARYPMKVNDMDHLLAQSDAHVEMETRMSDLLEGRTEPTVFEMAKPPRDYQRLPFTMAQARGGLLLADTLGLGKTVSALCGTVVPGYTPTVVVYPAYLPDHWSEKVAEFVPHLRCHTIRDGSVYPLVRQPGGRRRMHDLWPELPDVILITYHKLRAWAETLGEICQYAIFEEAQQLRNNGSEIYRASKYLANRAKVRMGLTATPIFNYGAEFFWIIDALIPGAMGEYDEFVREWCVGDLGNPGKQRLKDPDAFGAYLRREGIMLRRTRKEVRRELPRLSIIPHTVETDTKVLEKLTGDAVALARIIVGHNEQYRGQRMHASAEFDVLMRQATGIAKAPYVAQFVRILVENGEPVVLFGWHRAVYDIWMEALKDFNPVLYTGSESPAQKRAAKQAFLSGLSRVFIMSNRSGTGLDGLQAVCRTAVVGELDWSPAVHEQGFGRIDRDGQKDPTTAFYLICDEGSDPYIVDVLGIKREQSDGVINPGGLLVERIDTGENQLRALAAAFLKTKGIAVEEPASTVVPLRSAVRELSEVEA